MKRKLSIILLITLLLMQSFIVFADEGESPPSESLESEIEESVGSDETEDSPSIEPDSEKIKPLKLSSQSNVTEIYLGGKQADDSNIGTAKEDAVATFAKAKELATENQNIKTIYVCGTVSIEGDISLAGTNAKILRLPEFFGVLFKVEPGKSAILSDIIIDGNSEKMPSDRAVYGSLIKLKEAKIEILDRVQLINNVMSTNKYFNPPSNEVLEGGAINADESTIIMKGGLIAHNSACQGGGVFIAGNIASAPASKAFITAGQITNNKMLGTGETNKRFGGGAIYVNGIGEFEFDDNTY